MRAALRRLLDRIAPKREAEREGTLDLLDDPYREHPAHCKCYFHR